nr:uncharacterized protein LOC111755503 [Cavia porcellus]
MTEGPRLAWPSPARSGTAVGALEPRGDKRQKGTRASGLAATVHAHPGVPRAAQGAHPGREPARGTPHPSPPRPPPGSLRAAAVFLLKSAVAARSRAVALPVRPSAAASQALITQRPAPQAGLSHCRPARVHPHSSCFLCSPRCTQGNLKPQHRATFALQQGCGLRFSSCWSRYLCQKNHTSALPRGCPGCVLLPSSFPPAGEEADLYRALCGHCPGPQFPHLLTQSMVPAVQTQRTRRGGRG